MSFIETSALNSNNVEFAFQRLLTYILQNLTPEQLANDSRNITGSKTSVSKGVPVSLSNPNNGIYSNSSSVSNSFSSNKKGSNCC